MPKVRHLENNKIFTVSDAYYEKYKNRLEIIEDEKYSPPQIEAMHKHELEAYALEHFGVDLDKRKSQITLVSEVKEMIENAPIHDAHS